MKNKGPRPPVYLLINGLLTDDEGNGVLEVTLDFLLSEGVYPFEEFDSGFREAYLIRANDLRSGVASGGLGSLRRTIALRTHPSSLASHLTRHISREFQASCPGLTRQD